jgi:hypothetical protein
MFLIKSLTFSVFFTCVINASDLEKEAFFKFCYSSVRPVIVEKGFCDTLWKDAIKTTPHNGGLTFDQKQSIFSDVLVKSASASKLSLFGWLLSFNQKFVGMYGDYTGRLGYNFLNYKN